MVPKLIDMIRYLPSIGDCGLFYFDVICTELIQDRECIYRIDDKGLDHKCDMIVALDSSSSETIKIECIELVSAGFMRTAKAVQKAEITESYRDITGHLFKAKAGGYSFPVHTDPVDVIVWCIDGCKTMEVDGREYVVEKGMGLLMPANIPHRATNKFDSVMISIGFEEKK